jgi:senataxin
MPSYLNLCMNDIDLQVLLVDEAGQCPEPEVWVALAATGARRIALVGDVQQLPATSLSPLAERLGYARSLMERLSTGRGYASVMLAMQYRMNPHIASFSNARYYQGRLQNAPETHRHAGRAVFFYDVVGVERPAGTSVQNDAEAQAVVAYVTAHLQERSVAIASNVVAILTFYKAQVAEIQKRLDAAGLSGTKAVKVSSVDGYQGSEADVVVVSFVRTAPGGGIGFLRDFRRLNVALTRARDTLVLFGHVSALRAALGSDVAALVDHAVQNNWVERYVL